MARLYNPMANEGNSQGLYLSSLKFETRNNKKISKNILHEARRRLFYPLQQRRQGHSLFYPSQQRQQHIFSACARCCPTNQEAASKNRKTNKTKSKYNFEFIDV